MTQERKLIKPCAFIIAPDTSSMPSKIAAKMESFVLAVNLDILRLNARIETYNHCTEHAEKIRALQAIHDERKNIINRYPDTMVSYCPSYVTEIHHHLFNQIKDIAQHLDLPSTPDTNTSQILSEILNDIKPDKIAQLLNIFVEAAQIPQSSKDEYIHSALSALYTPLDEEYASFVSFLSTHEITFLGGQNSNNYLVRSLETNKSFILKIENRKGQPKETAERLIKSGLEDTLMPAYADRQVTCTTASGQKITRNISLIDFCEGGNLIHHAAEQKTDRDKIKASIDIYKQMVCFLIEVQKNNAIFTDMKNSNWLLSKTGQLKVSDTKGFCPTQSDGIYKVNSLENQWTQTICTSFMNPPEWAEESDEINAEQAHAFMLGKNIYQYLTGCSVKYLEETHVLGYDFSHAVFSTTLQGVVLKGMITDLINLSAEDRPTLDSVLSQLTLLQIYDACMELLDQIKAKDLSPDGIDTQEFLSSIQLEIDAAENIESISAIRDKLNDFVLMKEQIKQKQTDDFKTQSMNSMLKMKEEITTLKTMTLPTNVSNICEGTSDDSELKHR